MFAETGTIPASVPGAAVAGTDAPGAAGVGADDALLMLLLALANAAACCCC